MSPELIRYIARVTPPSIGLFIFLFLIPRSEKSLRIFTFILIFVLFRDAMTPEGLWLITSTLELRFIPQPLTLFLLALSSVGLVVLSHFTISKINDVKVWLKRPAMESTLIGLLGGGTVALLPFIFGVITARQDSQKPEGFILWTAIGAIAFFGNLLEETIFRGHLQNYLYELKISRTRVILLSGGAFAVCHSFLAFTVTHVGWPILIFTFYEGLICACLRERNGLLAAALAHGMGLFLILTGSFG